MDEQIFEQFDRAAANADRIISAVRDDQWEAPTPCAAWNVRALVNHVVTGSLFFLSVVTGGPPPDRGQDQLGDDPAATFRETTGRLRAALADDAVLSGTFDMPFGRSPGSQLVHMRTNEMVVHGWDVARATGQPTDFEPELAKWCMSMWRAMPQVPRGEGRPFAAEQEAPAQASEADRLAAYLGRAV